VSTIELRRDVVILACAISAGIHTAPLPSHLAEHPAAGVGFAAASVLLAVLVVVLTLRPAHTLALAGAAVVLAGLLASYAFAVTTGLPLIHPQAEPIDDLALFTKATELFGLLAAVSVLRRGRAVTVSTLQRAKGNLT